MKLNCLFILHCHSFNPFQYLLINLHLNFFPSDITSSLFLSLSCSLLTKDDDSVVFFLDFTNFYNKLWLPLLINQMFNNDCVDSVHDRQHGMCWSQLIICLTKQFLLLAQIRESVESTISRMFLLIFRYRNGTFIGNERCTRRYGKS